MLNVDPDKIITQQIKLPFGGAEQFEVDVLRLDKIHEFISGNKWFKLRFSLEEAKKSGKPIVTFGGAWSNHLLATAASCQLENLDCIGIVRGEKPVTLSPVLEYCAAMGMELRFLDREAYKKKTLPAQAGDYYFIPEGGYGETGKKGAATIATHYRETDYTHICCASGSGTTAAGLCVSAPLNSSVIAVSVLKNNTELERNTRSLAGHAGHLLHMNHDYSFGGYARFNQELIGFMNSLYNATSIPTDFVYTGKLFYAINDLAIKNFFLPGSKIVIIHSGGLKGNTSLSKGTLIF